MITMSASYQDYIPEVSWVSTFCVFVCTFCLVYLTTRRQNGIPPGPVLLPVIGNLHNLVGKDVKGNLRKLRQRYGDVFGLYIGNELTVFLNGYDAIHNALVKHGRQFSGRPMSEFQRLASKYPGVILANGQFWKEQRTFSLKCIQETCLRNGCRNIEHLIHEELDHLMQRLEQTSGPLVIDEYLHTSVGNVICMVLHRKRFDFDDTTFNKFLVCMRQLGEDFTFMATMTYCFPFLNRLPGDILGIGKMIKTAEWIRSLFWPPEKAKTETDKTSIADLYLDEISAQADNKDSSFTECNMQSTLYDLRGASIDTTTGTTLWAILFLARYPDIQRKMYEEIETVIGPENKPTVQDRQSLPYVESVILEVMRIAAAAPFGLPHTVSEDINFCGYFLPANCTVITNIESVLKDSDVWDKPDDFRPERFLSEDNTKVVIPKEFIPFSMGPRSCLGESLARIEIFIFIATLVQKFEFLPEVDGVVPEIKGQLGLTWRPVPYRVRFKKR